MKRRLIYAMTGILIFSIVHSCKKDIDEKVPEIPAATLETNKWIYENMSQYYYWNDQIPAGIDHTRESDPEAYFYKLLYENDRWSRITDDYQSLEAELSGDPSTMGYFPSFYLVGSKSIAIVVGYVYPGSAAAVAGLERGDIILSINNISLDTSNYYNLYSGKSYSVQLGAISGTSLVNTGQTLSMTARTTITDPAIFHKVLDAGGTKIGYLVYVEFISGNNNTFLTAIDNIFNEFKAAGISELIVDLRYNPGGDITSAVHLASSIAPATVVANSEIMVNLKYNDELQEFLEFNKRTDYLYHKFLANSSNIDMKRVYFLTTSTTASASELLITGLDPYMDVVRIGEPTYGKYAGSWVIPDDDEKWAMMPIVLKYANAEGYTDFEDGIPPTHEVDDNLFTALPFGDPADPLTAKAIQLITGTGKSVSENAKSGYPEIYKQVVPPQMNLKRNLYLPGLKKY